MIVATSGEAVEKCKDIISSYGGYLSPRERGVLARALETYTFLGCDKIIAAHARMSNEDFIAYLKATADKLAAVSIDVAEAEVGVASCSEVPETPNC